MKNTPYYFALLFLLSACSKNISDLSAYDLSPDEKRSWADFNSEELNLTFKYPKNEMLAKDSEELKNAIHVYNNKYENGSSRFNLLIKPFDGGSGRLRDVGDEMVRGTSFKFNYSLAHAGVIKYGSRQAYQHEYTTSTFYGNSTRHYQLLVPIDGERFLISFSADSRHYFPSKKKMHKILRSLKVQ